MIFPPNRIGAYSQHVLAIGGRTSILAFDIGSCELITDERPFKASLIRMPATVDRVSFGDDMFDLRARSGANRFLDDLLGSVQVLCQQEVGCQ